MHMTPYSVTIEETRRIEYLVHGDNIEEACEGATDKQRDSATPHDVRVVSKRIVAVREVAEGYGEGDANK